MTVATMNIKDPAVRELTVELARLRGVSMTEAVRQALTEAVARERSRREGLADRLLEIGRQAREKMAELGIEPLTDDLYAMYVGRGPLPRRSRRTAPVQGRRLRPHRHRGSPLTSFLSR